MSNNSKNTTLDHNATAQMLWDEYKLRQTHYWSSFNRFSLAIITITVIPYVKTEIVGQLENMIYLFPIVAIFITWFCSWLLWAEYQRLSGVRKQIDALLPKAWERPKFPVDSVIEKTRCSENRYMDMCAIFCRLYNSFDNKFLFAMA